MKLKTFNTETLPNLRVRSTKAFIHITVSTGIITISKAAAEKMSLKAGDQVVFHQDEDQPSEWFLQKVKQNGYVARINKGAGALVFNNSVLVRTILKSVACENKSGRILIAAEPVKYEKESIWPLITSSLLVNKQ